MLEVRVDGGGRVGSACRDER